MCNYLVIVLSLIFSVSCFASNGINSYMKMQGQQSSTTCTPGKPC